MIKDPVSAVIDGIGSLAKQFFGDNEQVQKFTEEANKRFDDLRQESIKGNLAVNAVEAAHPKIWVSGWRPYAGWVTVNLLIYGVAIHDHVVAFYQINYGYEMPPFPNEMIWGIVSGMLGLVVERGRGLLKGTARRQ